jgi:hypothetical protein
MTKYFDQDFFKFFLRFAAILSTSIVIILVARSYQNKSEPPKNSDQANVIKVLEK